MTSAKHQLTSVEKLSKASDIDVVFVERLLTEFCKLTAVEQKQLMIDFAPTISTKQLVEDTSPPAPAIDD